MTWLADVTVIPPAALILDHISMYATVSEDEVWVSSGDWGCGWLYRDGVEVVSTVSPWVVFVVIFVAFTGALLLTLARRRGPRRPEDDR
jgi:hypothetical protein